MRLLLDAPVDLARRVEGREGSRVPAGVTSCPIGMTVRVRLGGGLNLVPDFAMVTCMALRIELVDAARLSSAVVERRSGHGIESDRETLGARQPTAQGSGFVAT